MRSQLSAAHDAYVAIMTTVNHQIQTQLHRNTDSWRLRNACPPCTYLLENEPPLTQKMQIAIDGNNSLKRVLRSTREKDGSGKVINVESIECFDGRQVINDMYMSEDEVNIFANEVKRRCPSIDTSVCCT